MTRLITMSFLSRERVTCVDHRSLACFTDQSRVNRVGSAIQQGMWLLQTRRTCTLPQESKPYACLSSFPRPINLSTCEPSRMPLRDVCLKFSFESPARRWQIPGVRIHSAEMQGDTRERYMPLPFLAPEMIARGRVSRRTVTWKTLETLLYSPIFSVLVPQT